MSTILKALRRLEEEKAASEGRSLEEQTVVAHVGRGRRSRGGRWVASAAGCAVALGAVLWWVPLERGATDPAPSAGASPPEASAPGSPPPAAPPAPAPRAPATASPQRAPAPPVAGAREPAVARTLPSWPAPATRVPDAGATSPGARTPTAETVPRPRASSARTVPPSPARRTEPLALPPPRSPAAAPETTTVAVLPAPAPAVRVRQTLWHPDASRRVAMVSVPGRDGELRLHEGDAVGPLVVREIRPDSVVFLRGSVEHVQRVGAAR